MSKAEQRWTLAVFFCLAAAGFVVPFWPLSVVGILLMAAWGRWFFAIVVGLLLDLAWGAPVGLMHYLYFPFTILAVVAALMRLWVGRYFIDKTPPDTL